MILDQWTLFGLLGNVFFTARVLVQWIASEKAKQSVAPRLFWWLSLGGAVIMIVYSIVRTADPELREEPTPLPLLVGFIVTLVPYLRNLMLSYRISRPWHVLSYILAGAVFVLCGILLILMDAPVIRTRWFFIGALGSVIWYTRFIWQWLYSEIMKKSLFPIWFWYISFAGLVLNLSYSFIMGDIVFILSFVFNIVPISRNIILMKRREPGNPSLQK